MSNFRLRLVLLSALLALLTPHVAAQTVNGTLTGTVVDASGATIQGAQVLIVNQGTGEQRNTVTSASGIFEFSALQPGVYTVRVQQSGFKILERSNVTVTALEHVVLGNMALGVGGATEEVTVTQQGQTLDLETADLTGLITPKQLDDTVVRGRDVMNLLRVLPGVSTIEMDQGAEATEGSVFSSAQATGGSVGSFTPTTDGMRLDWNSAALDGQVGSNLNWPGLFMSTVSIEGVAEVKVVSDNYTAEYGRNLGSTVDIVSKTGTRDFHGVAYYFARNSVLNANDYFNNLAGTPRQDNTFSTAGGALGGPIYIPGHFNSNKDKLFFFYSEEDWQTSSPTGFTRLTVPTALERQGNFSQTFDQSGQLIVIKDPQTGQPFPGNIIPANRINPNGQALLNILPLPQNLPLSVTGGAYNFQWQESLKQPKRFQQLKLDYHPTSKDTITFTPRRWWANLQGFSQTRAFHNVPLLKAHHYYSNDSGLIAWTHVINTHIVNEFGTGFTGEKERGTPTGPHYFDPVTRTTRGFTLGQLFPSANPYNIIPQSIYGGVPDEPDVTNDGRLPKSVAYERFHLADDLSWTRGNHQLKFGIYTERAWGTDGKASCCWNGVFDFSRDPNNPLDTGWAFSNALLGNFRSYQESNARANYRGVATDVEWFAQDTYKATRRLSLTYGLRFYRFTPWQFDIGQGVEFVLGDYSRSKISPLYVPALDSSGNRVGKDPVTGQFVPPSLIGAFVPGVGDPFNGSVLSSQTGLGNGFVKQQAIQVAPRFGFAYDVFGNGKTAVRGGFGITKEATPNYGITTANAAFSQPVILTPTIVDNNMNQIFTATGAIFPNSQQAYDANGKVPSLYKYSFGIEQALPSQMVLNVNYVGNEGRHLFQTVNINTLPYGARFLPQNQDPTTGTALPDEFLRPYVGYGDITENLNNGTSNYNGLQAGLTRRFTRGLELGVAYTWAKALGYGGQDSDPLPLYRPARAWAYGPTFYDQTHMFVTNFIWDLPKASKFMPNSVVRHVLDDWQFGGVVNFSSGLPQTVSINTTDNADITGGGDGVRPNVVAQPQLPHGQRSFDRWFNTAAFARPAQGSPGDSSVRPIRGPGVNDWDLTISKLFPLWSESSNLEFRTELYNAFNHTQFQAVDTNALFDPAGNQVNADFGHVTATRPPRVIQLALRLRF